MTVVLCHLTLLVNFVEIHSHLTRSSPQAKNYCSISQQILREFIMDFTLSTALYVSLTDLFSLWQIKAAFLLNSSLSKWIFDRRWVLQWWNKHPRMQLWWWGLLWTVHCKISMFTMYMSPVWCYWTQYYKSISRRWVLQWWDQQSWLQLWWWWLLWSLHQQWILFGVSMPPGKS